MWEMKNIVRNKEWLDNTIFYIGERQLTIKNNLPELYKNYKIRFYNDLK